MRISRVLKFIYRKLKRVFRFRISLENSEKLHKLFQRRDTESVVQVLPTYRSFSTTQEFMAYIQGVKDGESLCDITTVVTEPPGQVRHLAILSTEEKLVDIIEQVPISGSLPSLMAEVIDEIVTMIESTHKEHINLKRNTNHHVIILMKQTVSSVALSIVIEGIITTRGNYIAGDIIVNYQGSARTYKIVDPESVDDIVKDVTQSIDYMTKLATEVNQISKINKSIPHTMYHMKKLINDNF